MAYGPDPIPRLKQQLGDEIRARLSGWRSADVAVLIGTDQPRISELRRGNLERFSLETLIRFATQLRCRVELRVSDRRDGQDRRAER